MGSVLVEVVQEMKKKGREKFSGPGGSKTGQRERYTFSDVVLVIVIVGFFLLGYVAGSLYGYNAGHKAGCLQRCEVLTQDVWEESVALQRVCPCGCVGWCTG